MRECVDHERGNYQSAAIGLILHIHHDLKRISLTRICSIESTDRITLLC